MNHYQLLGWILVLLGFLALGSYFIIVTLPPIGFGALIFGGSYLVFKHNKSG